jgi:predicted RNA-binding Zn ribbon-like protein
LRVPASIAPVKFVGGILCLDFVNTVGGWRSGRVLEDKLQTYADLIRWAELAGMEIARPSSAEPRQAAKVLGRALALRLAIHRLLNRLLDQRNPSLADLSVLKTELAIARKHQELSVERGKFRWAWDDGKALDSVLWRVSQSAADLLTSPILARVRRCPGENCGWIFLDRTRNHSRNWCDMKDCGNLAKVRRFRKRNAEPERK